MLRHDSPQAETIVAKHAVAAADRVANVRKHRDLHRVQATFLAWRVGPGVVAKVRVYRRNDHLRGKGRSNDCGTLHRM